MPSSTSAPVGTWDDAAKPSPPFIGALLRIALGRVRARMFRALHDAGFTDIQDPHLAALTYPAPDGTRPSEMARRAGISRQAMNHLLAQVEALGYLERRAAGDGERRLVYTTPRGWQATQTIWDCLTDVQAELAGEIGAARFAGFMDVLRQVALADLEAFKPRQNRKRPARKHLPPAAAGQSRTPRLSSRSSRHALLRPARSSKE